MLAVFLFHERLMLPFGWVGVQLFFVLSGFLITRILLSYRRLPFTQYLRTFYGRRTVRIFPLYYVYLGLVALVTVVSVAIFGRAPAQAQMAMDQLWWAILYGYNFLHATAGFEHSRVLTHFWSLAVEEQFYLVWPFFLWIVPRDRLVQMLILAVALGPVLRAITYVLAPEFGADPAMSAHVLPWCQADAFAVGALVSQVRIPKASQTLLVVTLLGLGLALLTAPSGTAWSSLGILPPITGVARSAGIFTVVNVVFALALSAVTQEGLGLRVLEGRALSRLGTLSYGFYVVHFPIQGATAVAFPGLPIVPKIALDFCLSIVLSEMSFRGLERPLLRLKSRYFAPVRRKEETVGECFDVEHLSPAVFRSGTPPDV